MSAEQPALPSRPKVRTAPLGALFSSPLNILLTVLSVWLLLMVVPAVVEWAFIKARVFATPAECRADEAGACWAFIVEKYRFILFGLYPWEEHWRPMVSMIVLVGLVVCSGVRGLWRRPWLLALGWVIGLIAVGVLMWGGVFGLAYVEDGKWGGLPVTLILAVFGIAFAFPLGVLLALGRRSKMPAIKALCVVYIELVRGVPLISLLFMASVMLPLFLPPGFDIDKLLRAEIATVLFTAAYIAETVRGGLQAIPQGQYEGANSLGLTYWQQMRKIILPQTLRVVIAPMVGIFITVLKDTSLVVVIGIYDLMLTAKAALHDAVWQGFGMEAYVFIGLIYFALCFSMGKYSRALEKHLSVGYAK